MSSFPPPTTSNLINTYPWRQLVQHSQLVLLEQLACIDSQAELSACICSNWLSICPNSSSSFALAPSGMELDPALGGEVERVFLALPLGDFFPFLSVFLKDILLSALFIQVFSNGLDSFSVSSGYFASQIWN